MTADQSTKYVVQSNRPLRIVVSASVANKGMERDKFEYCEESGECGLV
jgi:hypothetical protein